MKFDENGEQLVEHHTHYKEIDGYDETVWLTKSDHQLLHKRLREENKCNIQVEELRRIATAAHMRTPKHKKYYREYCEQNKERLTAASRERYEKNKKHIKETKKEYYMKNREKILARKAEYQKKQKEI